MFDSLPVVISVTSPGSAIDVCRAQLAARDGMSAEVYISNDGSFLIYCRPEYPSVLLTLPTPPISPPPIFMTCHHPAVLAISACAHVPPHPIDSLAVAHPLCEVADSIDSNGKVTNRNITIWVPTGGSPSIEKLMRDCK